MAPKIAYDSSSDALLFPAKNAVFFQGWVPDDFTREDHGLLCAEMSRLAYASPDVIERALGGIGFTSPDLIGGEDLEDRVASRGTQGFLTHSPQRGLTVLAFRGTESGKLEDLLLDGETLQRESPKSKGCFVHRGFFDGWDRVRDRVTHLLGGRRTKLLVTGHSLGAAIATLAAIETEADALITFGSPLVGNDKLGPLLSPKTKIRHRYVNCCDLITRIPPEKLDREHVAQLFAELAKVDKLGHFGAFFAHGAIQTATSALASVLHAVHLDPQFTHVFPARYADRTGKVRLGISPEDLRKDQEAARQGYRRTSSSAPLRDLADHAPINYVSIFTGRA